MKASEKKKQAKGKGSCSKHQFSGAVSGRSWNILKPMFWIWNVSMAIQIHGLANLPEKYANKAASMDVTAAIPSGILEILLYQLKIHRNDLDSEKAVRMILHWIRSCWSSANSKYLSNIHFNSKSVIHRERKMWEEKRKTYNSKASLRNKMRR